MKSFFAIDFFNSSSTLNKCVGGAVLLCALFFYSGCSSIEKYERLAREGDVEAQFYCATYHQEEAYEFQEDAADAKPEKKPYLVKQEKAHWRKFEEFCKMAAENDHHPYPPQ